MCCFLKFHTFGGKSKNFYKMKKVLYIIGAIALIYLVCCVMGPSVIKVERSATINASADAIKSQITDYNVFAKWSPWAEKDTAMKTTIEGEAGKVGHKYAWEGNKQVGKGTMEITSISTDTIIEKLDFSGKGVSDVFFILKADGAGTNVTWAMNMNIGFFGRGMMMFMKGKMDKMLGGDFEKGLEKLKTVAEAAPAIEGVANYEVKELNWDAKTYYGKKATVAFDKLGAFFAEYFPKMFVEAQKQKVVPASAPSCIFFTYDESKKETSCAAAVAVAKGDVKGWEKFDVPAGKVLLIEYFGAYEKSANAHMTMDKYMKEKSLTQGLVIEEYVTDPMVEKDTAKWQTNIYYMVK